VAVTVLTAGANTGGSASLALACTIPAGTNSFLITGGANRTINAPAVVGDNPPVIGVSCVRGATLVAGTVTCTQTATPAGAALPNLTANIDCPAGGTDPPDLVYSPATGTTITYTGAGGTVVNRPITVSRAAGAAGQGTAGGSTTVQNCVASAGFTATAALPVFPGGSGTPASGTIATSCTVPISPAAGLTGTLTCDEVQDAGVGGITTPTRTWNLSCPAAAPNFNSTPAPGGTVALSGAPGTVVNGGVSVNNNGQAPLTFTCTPGAGFTVTNGTSAGLAPGASQSVGVSCTTPSSPGTSTTGTLTCTTNDPDVPTVTFGLSCTALVLSIPTISAAGKTLLATLLMGLGLLGFAMRRRSNA
jgi:hypothetical protein